jgi:cellulose synthase (UDP-forming)
MKLAVVRPPDCDGAHETAALHALDGDWIALRTIALWLFHTPRHAVPGLPPGTPAVASA